MDITLLKGEISIYLFLDIYIDLWIYGFSYIDILRDIHVQRLDIYMWISL